jgi:alpha-N-acetylglucosaminidase
MGLYGQIMNVAVNSIKALNNETTNLVGFGLTMEGQEGNEIMYDLLLDQAWQETPIDTEEYFRGWVATRHDASNVTIPSSLFSAWELLRPTVYSNTNLTSDAVPKSILELVPSTTGMLNRTSHHPTTLNYDTAVLVAAWNLMYEAGQDESTLYTNAAYEYDLVDWTRQVLANAFVPLYETLLATSTTTNQTKCSIQTQGNKMFALLTTLDEVLATNENFSLSTWILAARDSANNTDMADFFEYEARNQITFWGPTGQISDYGSKSWAGLVSTYYLPRWQMFVDYLATTSSASYTQTTFACELLEWEEQWVAQTSGGHEPTDISSKDLQTVLQDMLKQWTDIFTSWTYLIHINKKGKLILN